MTHKIAMLGHDDCPACRRAKKDLADEIAAGKIEDVDIASDDGYQFLQRVEDELDTTISHTPTFVELDADGAPVQVCEVAVERGRIRPKC